jgi:hypothetical protein
LGLYNRPEVAAVPGDVSPTLLLLLLLLIIIIIIIIIGGTQNRFGALWRREKSVAPDDRIYTLCFFQLIAYEYRYEHYAR